jgi:hypothetical protein
VSETGYARCPAVRGPDQRMRLRSRDLTSKNLDALDPPDRCGNTTHLQIGASFAEGLVAQEQGGRIPFATIGIHVPGVICTEPNTVARTRQALRCELALTAWSVGRSAEDMCRNTTRGYLVRCGARAHGNTGASGKAAPIPCASRDHVLGSLVELLSIVCTHAATTSAAGSRNGG